MCTICIYCPVVVAKFLNILTATTEKSYTKANKILQMQIYWRTPEKDFCEVLLILSIYLVLTVLIF